MIGIPAKRVLAVLGLAIVLAPGTPAAEEEIGTFTVQFENDRIADTDRHYTHGTRVAWVSPGLRRHIPWAADVLEFLYPFDTYADARVGIALGQSMFTPANISATGLIADDRPYAGWLYAGLSLHVEAAQNLFGQRFDVLDTMELDLGIVGPHSYAEETQKLVHRNVGAPRPNGWDNQLDDEPGVVLVLERKWRTPELTVGDIALGDLALDALPHARVSLGNVSTELTGGVMVRLGQGLKADFGPPHIRPNLSGLGGFDPGGKLVWYAFAGAGGRVVGCNIFLDGNAFSSSHSVDRKVFVGDFPVGVAIAYGPARLTFSHVYRTREFDGQSEPDRFGAVSLSVRF